MKQIISANNKFSTETTLKKSANLFGKDIEFREMSEKIISSGFGKIKQPCETSSLKGVNINLKRKIADVMIQHPDCRHHQTSNQTYKSQFTSIYPY